MSQSAVATTPTLESRVAQHRASAFFRAMCMQVVYSNNSQEVITEQEVLQAIKTFEVLDSSVYVMRHCAFPFPSQPMIAQRDVTLLPASI